MFMLFIHVIAFYQNNEDVWMWELDCEESWAPKNWCFWTVVLEKTLESPLDCKEIQPVHSEGDQPWDFFGRNNAKAETPVLWPPSVKSRLVGKDSDAGGRRRRGWQRMRWMDGITDSMDVSLNSGSWWWTGRPGMLQFMGLQRVGHDWVTELNWSHIWEWLYVIISLCSHRSFHCVHLPYCLYDPNRSSFFTLQWEKPQLLLLAAVISSDYPCGFQSAWHFPDNSIIYNEHSCPFESTEYEGISLSGILLH